MLAGGAEAAPQSGGGDGAYRRVIVELRGASGRAAGDPGRAELRRAQERVETAVRVRGAARRFRHIPFVALEADTRDLAVLAAHPDVAAVHEDQLARPALAATTAHVGAPRAWALGGTGRGLVVAVLDTGVDASHPFLAGRGRGEACYSSTTTKSESLCPGGANSTTAGSAQPCQGIASCEHGTHVAGIAVGRDGSRSGVAPAADLLAIQVFSKVTDAALCGNPAPCLLSFASDQMLALERVYDLRATLNIAAVNLSLGGGRYAVSCDADPRAPLVERLRAAGIPTVISAGNDGYVDALSAPACIPSAISVGAVALIDGTERVAPFSNSAPFLRLLAPGATVTSSVPGGYAPASGTSMASPHVAGALAALRERAGAAGVDTLLRLLENTGASLVDPKSGRATPSLRLGRAAEGVAGPQITIDDPVGGRSVAQPFAVSGWAVDRSAASGSGVGPVHVYAYPDDGRPPVFLGAADVQVSRADVAGAFGWQFEHSGFSAVVDGLRPGPYRIAAFPYSSVSGRFGDAATVAVTVGDGMRAQIDLPLGNATVRQPFVAAGWAIDRASTLTSGVDIVHAYAYPLDREGPPVFVGAAAAASPRPDVGAAFGGQFAASGFAVPVAGLPGGRYRLAIFPRSRATGLFGEAATVEVQVASAAPVIVIDTPAPGTATRDLVVAGWAIDLGSTSGTGVDAVHIWAFPADGGAAIFLGAATLGGARPDVAAAFGQQFHSSGFGLTARPLSPGSYRIAAFLRSIVSNDFSAVAQTDVTIR